MKALMEAGGHGVDHMESIAMQAVALRLMRWLSVAREQAMLGASYGEREFARGQVCAIELALQTMGVEL